MTDFNVHARKVSTLARIFVCAAGVMGGTMANAQQSLPVELKSLDGTM
ncbi:hypothetical protein [Yoonia maritima]|nr:hypothetical protein [Yoonia maritima]